MKRQAKKNREKGLATAKRWWIQKYQTPIRPFEEISMSGLLIEMYEDMLATRDEIMEELANGRGDKTGLYDQLAKINEVLADDDEKQQYSSDPLIDKWEREIAEGKEIDLNEKWIG